MSAAALASAAGDGQSDEQCWESTFIRIGLTSPVRHARAGITMITVLRLLRHGRDHTDELAQVFSEALGPRELTLIADAAGMALSRRLEPQL